jgi:hypothetical protein
MPEIDETLKDSLLYWAGSYKKRSDRVHQPPEIDRGKLHSPDGREV